MENHPINLIFKCKFNLLASKLISSFSQNFIEFHFGAIFLGQFFMDPKSAATLHKKTNLLILYIRYFMQFFILSKYQNHTLNTIDSANAAKGLFTKFINIINDTITNYYQSYTLHKLLCLPAQIYYV